MLVSVSVLILALLVPIAHTDSASPNDTGSPKVVASVLPIHSLVSEIMHGVGTPQLLTPAAQSPHVSSLKPSQMKHLQNADLLVWVGELLEPALEKVVRQLSSRDTAVITLMKRNEITLLSAREKNELPEFTANHSEHDHEHEHEHGHAELSHDPHLWLSPTNAEAIARIVTDELVRLDPNNRHIYTANAENLLRRIAELRESLTQQIRAVADLPYVVFHDAYRYFEEEFDIHPLAMIVVNPDRPPGAKTIRDIKKLIHAKNVRCVFREPQFLPGAAATLVEGSQASLGILDPLGVELKVGVGAWFGLMQGVADSLTDCLSKQ